MTWTIDFIADRPGERFKSFGRNRFLFPLIYFRSTLQEYGIRLKFYENSDKTSSLAGEILCLDSRVFTERDGHVTNSSLGKLAQWRDQYEWVIWFDNRDSSGTTQFEVLPFVDRYAKKQLLSDRKLYMQPFYNGRIYSDFINERYKIQDVEPETPILITNRDDLSKLILSWNLAFSDYRSTNTWQRYINYALRFRPPLFYSNKDRTIDLQARFGSKYQHDTIIFHRQTFKEIAKHLPDHYAVASGFIAKDSYYEELKRTRSVLSPFGFGEICFRDFEAMQHGCALLKPSVAHLDTWPDLFESGGTYLALDWDFEIAKNQILELLGNRQKLLAIGEQGLESFKKIWNINATQNFAEHFLSIIEPKTSTPQA